MRAVRRLLLLALLLVLIAAIAFVVTARPQLDDSQDEVQSQWDALEASLDTRYDQLAAVTAAIDAPGPGAALASQVDDAIEQWRALRADDASVEDAIETANTLEGLARRLDVTVRASPRLGADTEVITALDAFVNAPPPEPLPQFNAVVRDYADERSGSLRSLLADLLGYDPVPALDLQSATTSVPAT